jgi:hypothetical protein
MGNTKTVQRIISDHEYINMEPILSIQNSLTALIDRYTDDVETRQKLEAIMSNLDNLYTSIPQKLLTDFQTLLHLLVDAKRDNARLWEQVVNLREELDLTKVWLESSSSETRKLREEFDLYKKQVSEEKFAVRQVYHALNEKLLRKVASMASKDINSLWKLRISNIGGIQRHADLMKAWHKLQRDFDITETPSEFWTALTDGKHPFDIHVHQGSFTAYPYSTLKDEIVEKVFIDELEGHKCTFSYFLELSHQLSLEAGCSIYDY